MNDEGFREIQLNGKQLVFLFMAATVVSVVIFLCGVLVGRGARPAGDPAAAAAAEVSPDPALAADARAAAPAPVETTAARPAEELSYAERLLRDTPPKETLKPTPAGAEPPAAAPAVNEPVAAPPPPAPARPSQSETVPPPAAPSQALDPSGPGFAVQVAAYRDRRDAETLAKQLIAKGYPAFVMDPVKGAPMTMFRVRVGKYRTLKDAEAASAQLQRAEQFDKAWIAR